MDNKQPSSTNPPSNGMSFKIDKAILDQSTIHENLSQDIIITTVDKAKLCMIKYRDVMKSMNDWVGYLGLFVTALVAMCSSDFKLFLGLQPEFWASIFLIITIISGVALVISVIKMYFNRKKSNINTIIKELCKRQED